MRLVRLRLDAALRLGGRAAVLVEGRADNGKGSPSPPSTFACGRSPSGRSTSRRAGYRPCSVRWRGAPMVSTTLSSGSPLAYQYLTSLRAIRCPRLRTTCLAMRGRGWRTRYTIGSTVWDRGLPVIAGDRWDTGVEVRIGVAPVSVTAALTQGTLSGPRVHDDNSGKQIAGRVEVRPALGLILGASAARGEYVTSEAGQALPVDPRLESYRQEGLGLDVEYSRGYWVVRSETVLSRWAIPQVQRPLLTETLGAWGTFVEARYKIRPGLMRRRAWITWASATSRGRCSKDGRRAGTLR